MLAALYISPLYLIALVALAFAVGLASKDIRCTKCGYPVLRREFRVGTGRLSFWVPTVRPACINCGAAIP